jgi:hypothetical protein
MQGAPDLEPENERDGSLRMSIRGKSQKFTLTLPKLWIPREMGRPLYFNMTPDGKKIKICATEAHGFSWLR